ncbi:uncharacterized protein [Macrobrachium rosenbergii]|uniref:uncharacterized protein isoform X2 n=1 Tax=Macrobrachium rosenbergii TaxID=79674 RepID=UPI0034D56FEA
MNCFMSVKMNAAERGHGYSMGKETLDDDDEATVSVDDGWNALHDNDHHANIEDGGGSDSSWDALEVGDDQGVTADYYQSFMVAEMADILMDSPLNEEGAEGRFFLCKKCLKKYVKCKGICRSLSTINGHSSDMVPCSTTCLQRLSACCFKKFRATKETIGSGLSSLFRRKQNQTSDTPNPQVSASQTAQDAEGITYTQVYGNPYQPGPGTNFFQGASNKFNQGSGPGGPGFFQNLKQPFQQGSGGNFFQGNKNPFQWGMPNFQVMNPFFAFPGFPKPTPVFGNDGSPTVVVTSTVQVLVTTCQLNTDTTTTMTETTTTMTDTTTTMTDTDTTTTTTLVSTETSELTSSEFPDPHTSAVMTESTHMPDPILVTETIHPVHPGYGSPSNPGYGSPSNPGYGSPSN